MIPRIIHYCWFGRGEMPELVQTCIASWRTHMPNWEYKLWNEETITQFIQQELMPGQNSPSFRKGVGVGLVVNWLDYMPKYVQEAYSAKKYAFVSDYVRLWALEREGGLYMDVDFEVYKPFDDLMEQYDAFVGYEGSKKNPVMMGVLSAKAHHPWIQGMLATYENRNFLKEDGSYDMTPNTGYFYEWMTKQGFVANGVEKDWNGVHILPVDYFCPGLTTGENVRSENTYCEHKGLHSWSGNGGWKATLLNMFPQSIKIRLIKLKRIILK